MDINADLLYSIKLNNYESIPVYDSSKFPYYYYYYYFGWVWRGSIGYNSGYSTII